MPSARPHRGHAVCVRCGGTATWRVSAYDVMRLRDEIEYACTAHVGHIIDGLPGRQGTVEGIA